MAAPKTPTNLVWIVERCLAKDPEDRYGSSKDLARDLAALRDQSSGISAVGVAPPAARRLRLSPRALIAAAIAVAVIGAAVIVGRSSVQYEPPTFQQLTFRRGRVLRARYTPDGGSIIYGASWEGTPREIFTSRLDGTRVAALRRQERRRPRRLVKRRVGGSAQENVERKRHPRHHASCGRGRAGTPRKRGRGGLESRRDAACRGDTRERRDEDRVPIGRRLYETKGRLDYSMRVSGSGKQIAFIESPPSTQPLAPVEFNLRIVDARGKATTLFRDRAPRQLLGCLWRRGDREVLLASWDTIKGHTSELHVVDLDGQVTTLYRGIGSFLPQDSLADGRLLVVQLKGAVDLMFGSSRRSSPEKPRVAQQFLAR